MEFSFVGICLAVSLVVVFVSLLLSESRRWATFLLAVGVCALFGSLAGWAFGGFVGDISHDSNLKASLQLKSGIVAALGLISTAIGAFGASKHSRSEE